MSRYLCPAPTATGRKCLEPIPCHGHGVTTPIVGAMTYGDEILEIRRRPVVVQTFVPTGPPVRVDDDLVPAWARRAGRDPWRPARVGLYAITCASIVYSLGDAAFTGRSLLAIVLTLTTAAVLIGRAGSEQIQ